MSCSVLTLREGIKKLLLMNLVVCNNTFNSEKMNNKILLMSCLQVRVLFWLPI